MEKEAKYLSVAGALRIINRHSVHLLTPLQILSVYSVTVTNESTKGYRKLSCAR